MSDHYVLAIDQGTTSTRAIVFDRDGAAKAVAQREFQQFFPDDGWVEHDPEEIWRSVLAVCREVLGALGADADKVAAIGITNQRETTVVWERDGGGAIYPAIVWQDRRTAAHCRNLKRDPAAEADVNTRSGLLIDPYFSATKVAWILDHVPGARARAERGELAFGTIDSFLLWRLTGGAVHATDATNAARTNLFNIHHQSWDPALLARFDVPAALLPEVHDSAADFGHTTTELFGRALPIRGVAGDQQAALFGQCCFTPGQLKSTYGTGCFMILNTGATPVRSGHRLLTTVGYRLAGTAHYALEGAIFVAGAAVQWLRDGLGVIGSAAETQALAAELPGNKGVYLVPAFTGLGAPYWDPDARGAIFGLTRDTGPAELARAALESVGYQTDELLDAMAADGVRADRLRVDGGMVANDWLCQFLADVTGRAVERPQVTETTALGAAFLAGLQSGIYADLDDIAGSWRLQQAFTPAMASADRDRLRQGWQRAVTRTRSD